MSKATTNDPEEPKTFDDGRHTLDTEQCQNCEHFRRNQSYGHGNCHRMPPQIVADAGGEGFGHKSLWPVVSENESCGEFKFNDNASPV